MAADRLQRRMAAVLAADVVGYSRLVGRDEESTLPTLKAYRSIIDKLVATHAGRIFGSAGDSVIVEFASPVEAVRCAAEIQFEIDRCNAARPEASRMRFRIGINLGDVVVDGDNLMGDGVNVAARLESLAEAGGICVSRAVRDQVRDRLAVSFVDLGERSVKNIARPLRVFRIDRQGAPAAPVVEPAAEASRPPSRSSIAVLPFTNMSSDPEQDYFADGIVEDIITALARFRHLFVIARNSSFAYRNQAVDIRRIGEELGVRYIVEGSVRKAGDRLRITGQLLDASTGLHLWADRFDGTLAEVFDLQDRIAASIVGAITPKVEEAEIERAKRKPTEDLGAYDNYLRGLSVHDRAVTDRRSMDDALRFFMQAIDRDPAFAAAYARAARCYAARKSNRWMVDRAKETVEAIRLARKAVELGRDDAVALAYGGYVLGYIGGDVDESTACIDQALQLNPNLAAAWGYSAWVKACLGEPETAIERAARAMRLSPLEPRFFAWEFCTALAHFCAGRHEDAVEWARRSLRSQPNYASAVRIATASYALAGRHSQAEAMMARLRELDPTLRLSALGDVLPPFRRKEDRDSYVEGLRMAGLPD